MIQASALVHPPSEPEPPSGIPSRARANWQLVVPTVAAALILHFARFGYGYGSSDQDETIPLILRLLDGSLFAGDWFIQSQEGLPGVRAAFVYLLAGVSTIMPMWLGFLLMHVASVSAVAAAIFILARRIAGSNAAAIATVIATIVLLPQWTLGGNDVVHAMLVPSTIAWAIGLWGLVLHLAGRDVAAGILLGLAVAFQALVGLHLAAVVGVHLLVGGRDRAPQHRLRAAAVFGLPFLLVCTPTFISLIISQWDSASAGAYPPLFYVMASFRNPHHYLPLSFPLSSYAKFGALSLSGGWAYAFFRRRALLSHASFLRTTAWYAGALLTTGFVFTELLPVLLVAKLQFFKITVLGKLLLLALTAGALVHGYPTGRKLEIELVRRPGRSGVLLLTLAILGFFLVGLRGGGVSARIHSLQHAGSELGAVERWAREHTAKDATFVVPPSVSTFRSNARRGVVVNFKAFPFQPEGARVWFKRLLAVAPMDLPERAGRDILDRLDQAYADQAPERLAAVALEFDADYLVVSKPLDAVPLEEVYASGTWRVYRPLHPFGVNLASGRSGHARHG